MVFYGVDAVINIVIQFLNQTNKTVYACVDQTRPILTLDILILKKAFEDAKRRGVKLKLELKKAYKMQKEFINIASHELRTPIQPILGLSEILKSRISKDRDEYDLIDIIARITNRLHRLTEDILDVTKIESRSLQLKKEKFNLNEVITNVLADYGSQVKKINDVKVSLINKGDFL